MKKTIWNDYKGFVAAFVVLLISTFVMEQIHIYFKLPIFGYESLFSFCFVLSISILPIIYFDKD